MVDPEQKNKIASEFRTMRILEQDAHDFYVKAADNPAITDSSISDKFRQIADDEKRHVEIVDTILNLVNNCM